MSQTSTSIRLALPSDIPQLQALDKASDQLFRTVGMDALLDSPSPSLEQYAESQTEGHTWVATTSNNTNIQSDPALSEPIAFIQIDIHTTVASFQTVYIHQVSVDPKHGRKGIGRQLIEYIEEWAREKDFKAMDLTTFDEVPWNRKYYERLGFRVLDTDKIEMEDARRVREVLEKEKIDAVLGRWKRVAMRKYI